MARFLWQSGLTHMSVIAPTNPPVKLPCGPCWVRCCWWESLELHLHDVHPHCHLWQLRHDSLFGAGKDYICLCQSFQLVTLRLNSLDDSIQTFYRLMMIFWRFSKYTVDFLTATVYPRLPWVVAPLLCSRWDLWGNVLNMAHILRLVVCCLRYMISLLKVAVCAKRVIPFDTIITLEIVCPPTCTNYLPFSNFLIWQERGSGGS